MFRLLPNLESLEYLENLKRDSYTSSLVVSVRSLLRTVEKVKRNADREEWFVDGGDTINVQHLLFFKDILPLDMFEALFSEYVKKYPLNISYEILNLSIELESENIYNLLDVSFLHVTLSTRIECLVRNFLTPLIGFSLMNNREDSVGKMEVITRVRTNPSFLEEIVKRDNLELLLFAYSVYAAKLVLPNYINSLVENNSYMIVTWFLDDNNNAYTTTQLVVEIFQRGRVYLAKLCHARGLVAHSDHPEIVKLLELYKEKRI